MSQDNLIKMSCQECKRINYWTNYNKKVGDEKLVLKKHCDNCRKHVEHKETKKK